MRSTSAEAQPQAGPLGGPCAFIGVCLRACLFAYVCVPFSKFHSTSESGKSFDTNFTQVESTTIAMSAAKLEFFLRSSAEELRRSKPTPVQRNRRLLLPL